MANNGEASVEEILESIKRVMERDSRDSAAAVARRRVEEAERADANANSGADAESAARKTADAEQEEVLDLAEM